MYYVRWWYILYRRRYNIF